MDNKEMFQKLANIFSTGDVSEVNNLFSENYIDHQKPEWMNETGAEEFKAIVKLARDSMPNLKVAIEGQIISDGDMVAGRMKWINDNVERETIEMLRVENGKFVEHWGAEAWSRKKDSSRK